MIGVGIGSWQDLAEVIEGLAPYYLPEKAPRECVVSPNISNTTLSDGYYREIEEKYDTEIEEALNVFFDSGKLPEVSNQAEYFLGVRCAVVSGQLLHLSISEKAGRDSIFPFPDDLTPAEMIRWLLVDWWKMWGDLYVRHDNYV